MKDLKSLSDSELLAETRLAVAAERKATAVVLAHLEEVEQRGLYLSLERSSMFEYCMRDLGFSENEANARISAMRLSREVPEVVAAVEEGRLSLTNLVKAKAHFNKSPMPVEQKREVLRSLEGLSTRECIRKLEPEAPQRKTFEVDDELLADLQRIRELWGNQDLSNTELLRKMAKLVLSKIDPEAKKSPGAPRYRKTSTLRRPSSLRPRRDTSLRQSDVRCGCGTAGAALIRGADPDMLCNSTTSFPTPTAARTWLRISGCSAGRITGRERAEQGCILPLSIR